MTSKEQTTMTDVDDIAQRYVALWNQPDPARRRAEIAALFAPDLMHCTKTKEARGHEEMETRVLGSYERWVRDGGCIFRFAGTPLGHHESVLLRWQMVTADGNTVRSIGSDFLILTEAGLIRRDYQFVD
jgi:hypothetical protein